MSRPRNPKAGERALEKHGIMKQIAAHPVIEERFRRIFEMNGWLPEYGQSCLETARRYVSLKGWNKELFAKFAAYAKGVGDAAEVEATLGILRDYSKQDALLARTSDQDVDDVEPVITDRDETRDVLREQMRGMNSPRKPEVRATKPPAPTPPRSEEAPETIGDTLRETIAEARGQQRPPKPTRDDTPIRDTLREALASSRTSEASPSDQGSNDEHQDANAV